MTATLSTQRDFNKAAHNYDNNASMQRMVAYRLAELAKTIFPGKTHLLDVGCGTGFITHALKGHNQVMQCDIAFGMCRQAQLAGPVFQCDMDRLPLGDNMVDGMTSSLAFQWTRDPSALVSETARVIRDEGYALISMAIPDSLREIITCFNDAGESERLHKFIPESKWVQLFQRHFTSVSFETKQYSFFYPDLYAALNSIRAIGGMNKGPSRRRYLSKSKLEQMARYYLAHFHSPYGASLTWDILTIVAKK